MHSESGIRRNLMSEIVTSKVDFKVLAEILQSYDYKKSYLIAMLQKVCYNNTDNKKRNSSDTKT